jgi:GAF domain-containing protein
MEPDKSLKLKAKAKLNSAFAAVMHEVTEILDCDRAALYLVDEATGETWTRVGKSEPSTTNYSSKGFFKREFTGNDANFGNAGEEFGDLKTIRFPRGEGVTGHVVKSGRTLNESDPYKSKHFVGARDKTQKYKTKSILSSPIFNRKGEVIGAITVVNKNSKGGFTIDDEHRLQAINSHIAIAIEEALMPVERSISEEFGKVDLAHNVRQMKLYFPDEDVGKVATSTAKTAAAALTGPRTSNPPTPSSE